MDAYIIENYKRYCARLNLFQKFGYDIAQERDFVIKKSQPLEGKILELGTGKGYFTIALAQRDYHFTSVDISREEQEFARMNIHYHKLDSYVNFVIGNAEQLHFNNGHYDVAFGINLIHHLEHPLKVIDELLRVVTQEGKIVLSDFSEEGFKIIRQIYMSEGRHHSKGKYNIEDVEKYLRKKNYQLEKFETRHQEMIIIYKGSY